MAATTTTGMIQEIYIGLLGRAADQAGLDYWIDQIDNNGFTIENLRANIVTDQTEYLEGKGQMTRTELVTSLYSDMFGRTADADDLAYWVDGDGSTVNADQLVLALTNGAVGDDITALDNKTEAAEYYTDASGDNYVAADATASVSTVDETEASVDASKIASDAAQITGDTFILTTGDDVFSGTSDSDLFVSASGTLSDDDVILDASLADSDVFNIVYESSDVNLVADITNVENINVDMDMLNGAEFKADNVTGATISVSSEKFGFDGEVTVSAAEDNNVTAGENVTELTVTGLEDGVVNAGSAAIVNITGSAAGDDVNVIVNGDVELNITTSTGTLNIEATEASVVTVTAAGGLSDFVGTGSGMLTLAGGTAVFTGKEITGVTALAVAGGGTLDLVDADVSAVAVTQLGGATTIIEADAGSAGVVADSSIFVLALNDDTDIEFSNYETATVSYADTIETVEELDAGDTAVTAVVASDLTFADTVGDVTFTGTGNVTVDESAAGNIDASGLTGDLTLESSDTSSDLVVVGSDGDNDLTFATVTGSVDVTTGNGTNDIDLSSLSTGTAAVTGGSGADTITATSIDTGTLAVQAGAGNDIVILGDISDDDDTVALQMGAGVDTLLVGDGASLTSTGVTLSGLEVLGSVGADETGALTVAAALLTDQSYIVTGINAANDNEAVTTSLGLTVDVTTDDTDVDLSGLTLAAGTGAAISTVIDASGNSAAQSIVGTGAVDNITGADGVNTIDAGAGNDTIVANDSADTIDAGTGDDSIDGAGGADVLTGGTGSDTFIFNTGDSTENAVGVDATMASIQDFTLSDFDVLNLDTVIATLEADATVDVAAADADATAADIDATVADGIMTLSGDDAAAIDTLAEWIDAAEVLMTASAATAGVLAFEFDGNTYVVEEIADATANVVELVGLTGIAAISDTAGVDTLVIID